MVGRAKKTLLAHLPRITLLSLSPKQHPARSYSLTHVFFPPSNGDCCTSKASQSYPFVLWRNVTTAEATEHLQRHGTANTAAGITTTIATQVALLESANSEGWKGGEGDAGGWVWLPTGMHTWYAAWKDLDGDRFVVQSDDSNILVHGFVQEQATAAEEDEQEEEEGGGSTHLGKKVSATWRVVVHNLDYTDVETAVSLAWPKEVVAKATVASWSLQRLLWDKTSGSPKITVTNSESSTAIAEASQGIVASRSSGNATPAAGSSKKKKLSLPTSLTLGPSELAILTVHASSKSAATMTKAVDERTFYPGRFLEDLAGTYATAVSAPYTFALGSAAPVFMKVRVGLGGNYAALDAALNGFHVEVNGAACSINPEQQMSKKVHVQAKDNSFFSSLEVVVPPTALLRLVTSSGSGGSGSGGNTVNVTAWSDAAGGLVVSTLVVVARFPSAI